MNTKKKTDWVSLAIFVFATLAIGFAGSLLGGSTESFAELEKPPLSPPAALFPVAWTVIYILLGVSAYRVQEDCGGNAKKLLRLYFIQIAATALWPLFFWRFSLYAFSAVWIVLLLALAALYFYQAKKRDAAAAYLTLPYILWLCFALYLNIGIAVLNR